MHVQNKWSFTYLVLSLELPPHVAFSVLLQKNSQSTVCSFWNQVLVWIHDVGWRAAEQQEKVEPSTSETSTPIKSFTDLQTTRSTIINFEYFYVVHWRYYGQSRSGKCKIELKGDQSVCNLTFVYYYPSLCKYFTVFPSEFYNRNSEDLGFYQVRAHRINLIDLYGQVKDAIFNLDINA